MEKGRLAVKTYQVSYKEYDSDHEKTIEVKATSSYEAYQKAMSIVDSVYGAYVESYTAKNGNKHYFSQNMIGKAF